MVQSLTFKKGGDEDLWSLDGLPLEMTVNLSVKDLYPTLMMSRSFSMMATNIGLMGFLDNMAGLSVTDWKFKGNILAALAQRLNYVAGIKQNVKNRSVQWLQDIKDRSSGAGIFRRLP